MRQKFAKPQKSQKSFAPNFGKFSGNREIVRYVDIVLALPTFFFILIFCMYFVFARAKRGRVVEDEVEKVNRRPDTARHGTPKT